MAKPEIHPRRIVCCSGKARYTSAVAAYRVLKHQRKRHVDHAASMAPYQCSWCGGYHLGDRHKEVRRRVVDTARQDLNDAILEALDDLATAAAEERWLHEELP